MGDPAAGVPGGLPGFGGVLDASSDARPEGVSDDGDAGRQP